MSKSTEHEPGGAAHDKQGTRAHTRIEFTKFPGAHPLQHICAKAKERLSKKAKRRETIATAATTASYQRHYNEDDLAIDRTSAPDGQSRVRTRRLRRCRRNHGPQTRQPSSAHRLTNPYQDLRRRALSLSKNGPSSRQSRLFAPRQEI